jgi:hypothetical protein
VRLGNARAAQEKAIDQKRVLSEHGDGCSFLLGDRYQFAQRIFRKALRRYKLWLASGSSETDQCRARASACTIAYAVRPAGDGAATRPLQAAFISI